RNALPFAARHLYPSIGEALMNVERLARRVCALCGEIARRDRRIAECGYLQIFVIDTVEFGCLCVCERFGLIAHFPVTRRIHEPVSEQRSNEVGIVCLLRLQPLLFQLHYSFFGPTTLFFLRPCGTPQQEQTDQTTYASGFHR